MSLKVTKVGDLFLIEGYTYPIKDKLKELGCRWDGDRRAWTTTDIKVARDIRDNPPKETIEKDALVVIAKAEYKGNDYPVIFRKDPGMKLSFTDGTAVFWAKEGAKILEEYDPPISLEDFS